MQDRKTTPLKFVWCNIIHLITKFFKGELTKIHCWNTTWMKMLLKSANNNSLLFKTGEWFLKSVFFTVLYRSCFCHKHRWNPCVTIRISPLHQHHHHHICSFGQSSIFLLTRIKNPLQSISAKYQFMPIIVGLCLCAHMSAEACMLTYTVFQALHLSCVHHAFLEYAAPCNGDGLPCQYSCRITGEHLVCVMYCVCAKAWTCACVPLHMCLLTAYSACFLPFIAVQLNVCLNN